MAYLLRYADGATQPLTGRVAITRQDNDLLKVDTVQASFSTSLSLPDDVATHRRLGQAQAGTSLSTAPYAGLACALEAGGVEVLPGARLALDDYTPRAGYTAKLLAGNRSFYDLLGDKKLRELDLSAFDHEWTLANVAAGAAHSRWQDGYCYDLYDRGLGTPPLPSAGSSRLFEAGYWPTAYARAVWEAIFAGAGVKWSGELPAVFDTALLPATAPFGYSDATRAAQEVVAGYLPSAESHTYTDEQDAVLPYAYTLPYRRPGPPVVDNTDLRLGSGASFDPLTHSYTVTVPGFYDLRADQDVSIYCNANLNGEVAAAVEVQVNGVRLDVDFIRGHGRLETTLTALAERVQLRPGDVVVARYKFDGFATGSFPISTGPFSAEWELLPNGRLTVQLLADFPPGGQVHLADWLPDMLQKDYVKAFIQAYGLTQTTDPYTGAVLFRRTAAVLDDPLTTAQDWSSRIDGSQPARRSWRLGDFAQRNWFRWKADDSNTAYAQAQQEQQRPGVPWNDDAAKAAALAFAAGYLDNGAGDTSLDPAKDVLTLPFAASPAGDATLLLIPFWKPKVGTNYGDDLAAIAQAQADGTYTTDEAQAARTKALGDDFDTQTPVARLCYQLAATTRAVKLEDDKGNTQVVEMRLSYFADRAQAEDLDFARSILPLYYPHLAAALVRPLMLRPAVRFSAAQVVAFDQLKLIWIEAEQAFFFVNKLDGWEEGDASSPVELIRIG